MIKPDSSVVVLIMDKVTGKLPPLVSVQKAEVTATGSREIRTSPAAKLGSLGRIIFPKDRAKSGMMP